MKWFCFWLIVEGTWKTPIDPIKAAGFGFHAEMAAFCVESDGNRNFYPDPPKKPPYNGTRKN